MRRLLVLLPTALLLAACGGGYGGDGNSAGSGSGSVIKTIQISEQEYSLTPATVSLAKAGTYAFQVTNKGTITHAFTIAAGGGNKVESGDIQPGSHKTVKYAFAAGTSYQMYCPIDGHRAQGMNGTIKVGGGTSGGTTTSPSGGTTTHGGYGY
jgi:uncharacterized cupredoxin-like copper-binding protein